MNKLKKEIETVLNSPNFTEFLGKMNSNFFNIKQELLIRNYLVESLNQKFNQSTEYRALAEYPREGNKKVDLSINSKIDSYLVELKFQFTRDIKRHSCFRKTIEVNLFERNISGASIDLLIIIVAEWGITDFNSYIEKYGANLKLSQYQSSDSTWFDTLFKDLSSNSRIKFEVLNVGVENPFDTKYSIFMVERNA